MFQSSPPNQEAFHIEERGCSLILPHRDMASAIAKNIQTSMQYKQFFRHINQRDPFPYQQKFGVAEPQSSQLTIPTGGAKTLAVLMRWLWRHHQGLPVATRLVVVEPMRVLVSQIVSECERIVEASGLDIRVHRLMGGDVDNSWIDYPAQAAIIVGTQDQVLSRCLMRGYASSRWSWPKHFALLHNDCEYFIDETQLMGPGYSTTAWLAALRATQGTFGPPVVVTWASATLDPTPLEIAELELKEWALEPADYQHLELRSRINRLKRLSVANTKLGSDLDEFTQALAAEVLENHEPDTLSLVILGQVDRALATYQQLQRARIPTRLLHSRFRRCDRQLLTDRLLDFKGILVSTQVVEAGVDLDARRLYTDLSSWASFVQRAGRCGRRGTYPTADIYWINAENLTEGLCQPYSLEACEFTQSTLQALPDATISTLLEVTLPAQESLGPLLTLSRMKDLFNTHLGPDGLDLDIAEFIREESDRNVYVAWFSGDLPPDDWQPIEDELCPVPIYKLKGFKGYQWNDFETCWQPIKRLRRGEVIVLPQNAGGYSATLGWTGSLIDVPSIPKNTEQREFYHQDKRSYTKAFVSLKDHSQDAAEEMINILARLPFEIPLNLPEIARWHDLGKAHEIFQAAMGLKHPDSVWAKGHFSKRYMRRGFRHELASALAALYHGKPFYFAYLVAAHHGKVRCTIAPMPWELSNTYRGIESGDVLPATDLGNEFIEASQLNVPDVGWWKEEVYELTKNIGVFRLAYLETLIRAADVQASARY